MFSIARFPKKSDWFLFEASDTENFRVLLARVTNDVAFTRIVLEADKTDEGFARLLDYFAKEVLLDWDGITAEDGTPYEPTFEHKRHALESWRKLRSFILTKSLNEEGFRGNAPAGNGSLATGDPKSPASPDTSAAGSAESRSEETVEASVAP